jgi:hypothetical protein
MKTTVLKLPSNLYNWWQHVKQSRFWPLSAGVLGCGLLFKESGGLLQLLDKSAAPIDIGILSIIPLALLCMMLFLSLCISLLQVLMPQLSLYDKQYFVSQFNLLPPWQQFKIYLGSYFALLLCCVLALAALL